MSSMLASFTLKSKFLEGLLKSWLIILSSEIGDKTFFIAAVMAMKNSRRQVFAGAISALAAMTVLSAVIGAAAPALISKQYTHYAATALFFIFGIRLLYDGIVNGGESAEDELREVEEELKVSHDHDVSKGKGSPALSALRKIVSPVFLEAFTLTFLAEWGDRSQIATIGLAAASDVLGVTIGGILGHAICTGAAVIGGKHMASHIDERMMAIAGGLLFIVFGLHSWFFIDA